MSDRAKVTGLETLHCDAGWRNYHFVKLTTEEGITGWSEFDEGFGSPGVSTVIETLKGRVVGRSVMDHERIASELFALTRPAAGGISGQGLGAIENALLDAKARTLGVPCHALLGGKVRDRIPLYWSHCGTWRINHPDWYGPAITSLDGVKALGEEVTRRGFKALKTNVFTYADGVARGWRPGFGTPFEPARNVTRAVLSGLHAHLEAFRDGAGPDADILLDLNFNATTEGLVKIVRSLKGHDLFWVEIDSYSPAGLAYVRSRSPHPVSSCETLIGVREFLPYFDRQAMDVAIVDAVWNGVWQAMKIAGLAEAHEVNVAPHNFYGHLCTMMNAHFAAAVPHLRIMEIDVDRIAWDDELFTSAPRIEDGELVLSDAPGWGVEPVEEAIAAHPPRGGAGMLGYRRS